MLRGATAADFGFVRSVASRPDYAPFITDEPDAALAGYLADPDSALLIWDRDGAPAGFALFCGLGGPSGVIELRRLALATAGQGLGRSFLRVLLDHGFGTLGAKRLWLDASAENPRALRLYETMGFTREGLLRRHWFRPALGRTVDMVLFGMLRAEWESLEPPSARA